MATTPPPVPRLSIPNTVEVALRMRLFNQQCVNTFAYKYSTQPTSAVMTQLANDVIARVLPVYRLATSNNLSFESVRVQDLLVPTGISVEVPITSGTVGQIGSPSLPGNVTIAVSKRTGRAGRSYRGRLFVPGIPASAVVGDAITPAYAAFIQNIGLAWVSLSDPDSSRTPVVASTLRGVATQILSIIVEVLLDSMRRRLASRGV